MFQRINVNPKNPQERQVARAVEIMKKTGGICIYPTDTLYGVGCTVSNVKKIDEIAKILSKDPSRKFSIVCNSISQAAKYVEISDSNFKIIKKYLPGPYTFILPSLKFVQKKISAKRKTLGIRVTGFPVTRMLIDLLEEPLLNVSLNTGEENHGDPDLYMTPKVTNGVDVILDAGAMDGGDSTVVDLTGDEPIVLRWGKGEFLL
jgi:tRNA threonylcarbamoyl adenosine modification protein (Sua5/YciO/YrdC/YwlC family)